ncbi:MAG: hypothetical protein WCI18_15525 [Pseudomonadota bacterium]
MAPKKGRPPNNTCTEDIHLKNSSWSKMLAKVFRIDETKCQHCKGDMAGYSGSHHQPQ